MSHRSFSRYNKRVATLVMGGHIMNKLSIIGVPMDLGQTRRGVDMGPSEIALAERVHSDENTNLKNLKAVADASERLAQTVSDVITNKRFPLVLGGDHSIAIGTLAGVSRHYQNLGVIWYDAHGDLNTADTSPSGNIHGMPLAASIGIGDEALTRIGGYTPKVKPENIVIIGARSLDEGEKELIKEKGIKVYTMHEIDRMGMTKVMEETILYLRDKTDGVHLSLDLDGLDPHDAPGVGTPVIGGISYRESHLAMEMLAESQLITSAEFVEVNPILDERNKTATVAVALMGSLLGEKLV